MTSSRVSSSTKGSAEKGGSKAAKCAPSAAVFATVPSLAWAHPIVQEWFVGKFGTPTEPQEAGWPHIVSHRSVLISAPTGSGKTLAAFLACIDALVRKAIDGKLSDFTEVLYVSPLKALSNDVNKNLEQPLGEILELARSKGIEMADIRTAVRTGDTLQFERAKMLRHPPHILVTTPESLYILLTAEKSRAILANVSTVIVDEIHAMADDKRGSHLALTLERLEALVGKSPVRVGLSATQKPIEQIAQFLVGSKRAMPEIIQIGSKRKLDIAIEVPNSPLGAVASNEMWDEMYDRITQLGNAHRSTLVFVNTRKMAERVAHRLAERLGEENVATHHGSLARRLRLKAEQRLKAGELKVLVCTASLELGIDIGHVDLVCQIGSPRSIAVALQRIGRAGHWRGAIPKGRLFATTRDELVECAALVKAIHDGELDRIIIPTAPRDVLAQQIVASCATNEWSEDELFERMRAAYPYRDLDRKTYDEIIEMLSEGVAGRKVRYGKYLHHDSINKRLKGRRNARLVAITNGGAIPDNSLFTVLAEPDQVVVGTIDEDFAVESSRGDIFLLGNSSWEIRRVEGNTGRILVEDAHGAPPTVPFWRGEAPSRTVELSACVSNIRKAVDERLFPSEHRGNGKNGDSPVGTAMQYLMQECGLDKRGAEQVVEYITNGKAILGAVPTQEQIIAERFFDESGGMQLVIHAPFGGRINKAWGLALRKKFCRSFNLELQAAATDDGINISLTEQHSFPLSDVFFYVHQNSLKEVLEQTALVSPLFATRWRWDAGRALALLRFSSGKKVPPQIQRMRSEDLLAAVFPQAAACQDNIEGDIEIPDHPLVNEVMNDILTEAMDMDGLMDVITRINSGEIQCLAVDTPQPSEFSHEILNANPYAYLDDAPLEERRARAVEMRRMLPDKVVAEFGQLDAAAIEQVRGEAMPDIRDADELHDLLISLIGLPEGRNWPDGSSSHLWKPYFDELVRTGRAITCGANNKQYWVPKEMESSFRTVFEQTSNDVPDGTRTREDLLEQAISGWLMHTGPITSIYLSMETGIPAPDIDLALIGLETRGSVLRGNFTGSTAGLEWCDRALLARIHRLTIGIIRRQIEPVTAAQFMRWLFNWQHVTPGSQLVVDHGTMEVLRQLQGFEAPASAWESQLLSRRIKNYKSMYLDNLCLTGRVGWARLSPHPALFPEVEGVERAANRRVIPTSASPITFYLREECNWLELSSSGLDLSVLSTQARKVLEILTEKGASFFLDVVRLSNLLKSEVELALWELVTAGLVTADGFDNLRALIDQKRRAGAGSSGKYSRPRHSQGRWSQLSAYGSEDIDVKTEAACWMLLKRYGVIFRELLTRESNIPKWREMLLMLRRLEAQGKLRGGRFVNGFLGEQFALTDAVESLRASKNQALPGDGIIKVSASDPLNLSGIIVPGPRVASNSGGVVVFENGAFLRVDEF